MSGEEFADNDFLEESNEYIRQVTNVESVTKGGISNITILDGGQGYKVGDLTSFNHVIQKVLDLVLKFLKLLD